MLGVMARTTVPQAMRRSRKPQSAQCRQLGFEHVFHLRQSERPEHLLFISSSSEAVKT